MAIYGQVKVEHSDWGAWYSTFNSLVVQRGLPIDIYSPEAIGLLKTPIFYLIIKYLKNLNIRNE